LLIAGRRQARDRGLGGVVAVAAARDNRTNGGDVGRPSAPGLDEFRWVRACPGPSQRGLSDRKENGTAKHAKHAKSGGALQVQDDTFDLKAGLAEVEQQAEVQARGFQIIQALRVMNLVDRLGYLQFDEDDVFDE
jgi:hypothetical protein